MTKRIWITIGFALLAILWSGYSALAYLGAAFPDYADDEIFNQIKSLKMSVILWRWLAVSLLLWMTWKYFRRGTDVQ